MSIINKRRNPFEILNLNDGETSTRKIEMAYFNMRKKLDNQSVEGKTISPTNYEELEKAFQELIDYSNENSIQESDEEVISANFLPISQNKSYVQNSNNNKINNAYYDSDQNIININERVSKSIDSLMEMKIKNRKVTALSTKRPELIKELEKIISKTDNISGNLLKELREKMSVNIDEMSNKIKVSKLYLEAIENNSFEKLPAEVYAKGFFNSYLNYIGLDRKDLVEALMKVYRAKKRLIKKR